MKSRHAPYIALARGRSDQQTDQDPSLEVGVVDILHLQHRLDLNLVVVGRQMHDLYGSSRYCVDQLNSQVG